MRSPVGLDGATSGGLVASESTSCSSIPNRVAPPRGQRRRVAAAGTAAPLGDERSMTQQNPYLRERVTGKGSRRADRLLVAAARGAKWLTEPTGLVWRIVDKLRRPTIPGI